MTPWLVEGRLEKAARKVPTGISSLGFRKFGALGFYVSLARAFGV